MTKSTGRVWDTLATSLPSRSTLGLTDCKIKMRRKSFVRARKTTGFGSRMAADLLHPQRSRKNLQAGNQAVPDRKISRASTPAAALCWQQHESIP
ncbi:hypothetical protein G6F68_019703 [Rhizopus microsporus]|nr:hypothetical protein G6F68_019703 [Rhizopus microsporus]